MTREASAVSGECAAQSQTSANRVDFGIEDRTYVVSAEAIAVRRLPDERSERTGDHVTRGTVFTATEVREGIDQRTYLRLSDGRGWVFDDSKLYPGDPSVTLLRIGPATTAEELAGEKAPVGASDFGGGSHGPRAQILASIEEHHQGCTGVACTEHTFYFVRVVKGKQEACIEVQPSEYTIQLDRQDGAKLGLKIEVQQSAGCLLIKDILGGRAQEWNEANPNKMVRRGDRIVRVNAVQGLPREAHKMNEECKKKEVLAIALLRGSACPIMPGMHVTVNKAFGQLSAGQIGCVAHVDDDGDSLVKFDGYGQQWVGRESYKNIAFEDLEGFYLKRYEEFKDFHKALKKSIAAGQSVVRTLPNLPGQEIIGFRRLLASMSMGNFFEDRKKGLQSMLDQILGQVPSLEADAIVAQFFGKLAVPPECGGGPKMQETLKTRLESLVDKVRRCRAEQEKAKVAIN